jgi:hypothetical protein
LPRTVQSGQALSTYAEIMTSRDGSYNCNDEFCAYFLPRRLPLQVGKVNFLV